ncbi:glycosyltransferase family 61 protein [Methylorubrum sp. DB1722]|nr:glycosyltransferase family 61 protein [Methylorubrum sp. DB1722]
MPQAAHPEFMRQSSWNCIVMIGVEVKCFSSSFDFYPVYDGSASRTPLEVELRGQIPQWYLDRHREQQAFIGPRGYYLYENAKAGVFGTIIEDHRVICPGDRQNAHLLRDRLSREINADAQHPAALGAQGKLKEKKSPYPVILLGNAGYRVFGHWTIDILPSLWLMNKCLLAKGLNPRSFKIAIASDCPRWALNMMEEIFDITEDDCIFYDHYTEVLVADQIYIPSPLRVGAVFHPLTNDFADELSAAYALNPKWQNNKKIFISRQNVKSAVGRTILNEEKLASIAKQKGFEVVDPADMSWPEQISLFCSSSIVVGGFGSGLHSTLFSSGRTVVVPLGFARMNWIQSGIGAVRGQRMLYLFPVQEDYPDDHGMLLYDEGLFSLLLEQAIALA